MCRKEKGTYFSPRHVGVKPNGLNPLTYANIWTEIERSSIINGCELWVLNSTNLRKIRRVQQYVAKSIQSLLSSTPEPCINPLDQSSHATGCLLNMYSTGVVQPTANVDQAVEIESVHLLKFEAYWTEGFYNTLSSEVVTFVTTKIPECNSGTAPIHEMHESF